MLKVTFHGVRGSTPCPGESTRRYGGNTSCVSLDAPGCSRFIFDMGTGLRSYGETLGSDHDIEIHALVTHYHWDHVQGLPFFGPALSPEAKIHIYGPRGGDRSAAECLRRFISPPLFPIPLDEIPADLVFHDVVDTEMQVGGATVTVRSVPHVGPTNGYRVEMGGFVVAYVSDHQMPVDDAEVSDGVLELARGADVLIHDAQFTEAEFAARPDWGHCTVDYAVDVALAAGARRLVLYHHDPSHDDATMDALVNGAGSRIDGSLEEVVAAMEGLTISLG